MGYKDQGKVNYQGYKDNGRVYYHGYKDQGKVYYQGYKDKGRLYCMGYKIQGGVYLDERTRAGDPDPQKYADTRTRIQGVKYQPLTAKKKPKFKLFKKRDKIFYIFNQILR